LEPWRQEALSAHLQQRSLEFRRGQRCRTHLEVAAPEPPPEKATAEWIMELIGIDVMHCPRCGSDALKRTELPAMRVIYGTPTPAPRDTS
jgi:hypothetical protein